MLAVTPAAGPGAMPVPFENDGFSTGSAIPGDRGVSALKTQHFELAMSTDQADGERMMLALASVWVQVGVHVVRQRHGIVL